MGQKKPDKWHNQDTVANLHWRGVLCCAYCARQTGLDVLLPLPASYNYGESEMKLIQIKLKWARQIGHLQAFARIALSPIYVTVIAPQKIGNASQQIFCVEAKQWIVCWRHAVNQTIMYSVIDCLKSKSFGKIRAKSICKLDGSFYKVSTRKKQARTNLLWTRTLWTKEVAQVTCNSELKA